MDSRPLTSLHAASEPLPELRGANRVEGTSARLARFLVGSRWEDVPGPVRNEAKRSLVNFFAAALGGSGDTAVAHTYRVLSRFSGPPSCSLIGREERLDGLSAAFVNAVSANVLDFDDTHVPTVIHPAAPIAPVLLALAEMQAVSGPQLLHAFVLGVEVACRLGRAVSPHHYRRGWHITATCGVFGAAAASGKLIGLDPAQMRWALGNAAAQSCGLVETLGTMAKNVGVGNAARNGLVSAFFAREGLMGPEEPIEGARGFARVMGEASDLTRLEDGLGDSWEILANTYKPYPCGVVLNPVIDCCLELRTPVSPGAVRRVTVTAPPLLRQRADRARPISGREAQLSVQHTVAVALLRGVPTLESYSDGAAADADVLSLGSRVAVEEDLGMPDGAARVTIELEAGACVTAETRNAVGSLAKPMTDRMLEEKLLSLAGDRSFAPHRLIETVWTLDLVERAEELIKLARPRRARNTRS